MWRYFKRATVEFLAGSYQQSCTRIICRFFTDWKHWHLTFDDSKVLAAYFHIFIYILIWFVLMWEENTFIRSAKKRYFSWHLIIPAADAKSLSLLNIWRQESYVLSSVCMRLSLHGVLIDGIYNIMEVASAEKYLPYKTALYRINYKFYSFFPLQG